MKILRLSTLFQVAVLLACTSPAALAQFSIIADFDGTAAGALPEGNLVQAPDGNFYGEDIVGGANGTGAVFKLTPAGALTAFYTAPSGAVTPVALTIGSDGYFYGANETGGMDGYGSVFKISPAGTLTTLYSFQNSTDGSYPVGTLVQGSDGNFYGETNQGGDVSLCFNPYLGLSNGCGTLFRITPAGAFSVVYTFQGTTDGGFPSGGLVQGSDGNYYGLTGGTVFRYVPGGSVTTIATFPTTNAIAAPNGPLVEDASGNYWGTAAEGGAYGEGVVFKASAANGFQLVWTFCSDTNCAGGGTPYAPLFAASDGNFYGSTFAGSDPAGCAGFGCGTVFRVTPAGVLTALYSSTDSNTLDGVLPGSTVIQGSNGKFYTTAGHGGTGANSSLCGGDNCGIAFTLSEGLAAPVVLTLSPSTALANTPVTLSYTVSQAISTTSQQCYAFGGGAGGGNWSGKQTGTYSSTTHAWSGSATITPTADGTYVYALTCGGQVSGFATLTVAGTGATATTTLTATPNPISIGQRVSVAATVKGAGTTPTGTVSFYYGAAKLATAALNGSGVASLSSPTAGLPARTYTVTAIYNGNSAYAVSTAATLNIPLGLAPTATALTVTPTPVTQPGIATFSAQVTRSASGALGVPTGTVAFYYHNAVVASAPLNASGVAAFSASSSAVPPGSYPVTAQYLGDASDSPSTSAAVTVTVK